jgi:hypothetical protein
LRVVEDELDRRGFWRSPTGTASACSWDACTVFWETRVVGLEKQYDSHESESEVRAEDWESSEVCEAESDQTDVDEADAEVAKAEE